MSVAYFSQFVSSHNYGNNSNDSNFITINNRYDRNFITINNGNDSNFITAMDHSNDPAYHFTSDPVSDPISDPVSDSVSDCICPRI